MVQPFIVHLANCQDPYFIKGSRFTDCVALNQTFNSISAFEDEVSVTNMKNIRQLINCIFSRRDIVISLFSPTALARLRSRSASTWMAAAAKRMVSSPFVQLATGNMEYVGTCGRRYEFVTTIRYIRSISSKLLLHVDEQGQTYVG